MLRIEIVNKKLVFSKYADVILGRDGRIKLNNGKRILVVFSKGVGTTTLGNMHPKLF